MNIAVVAANGRVAGKVITEAQNRGFEVTAFGRRENNTDAKTYIHKDLFDLTAEDLKGFDAVVDAFGAWTEDTLYQPFTATRMEPATMTLIPYFLWNNRGEGEMTVWMNR